MNRKVISSIISILCIVVIIVSLVAIYFSIMPKKNEEAKYDEIMQTAVDQGADVRLVFK